MINDIPGVDDLIDPSRVTPGLLGLGTFIFLIVMVVVIWFTMNRSLKTTDRNYQPGQDGLLKPNEKAPRTDESR